MKALKCIH